MSQTHESADAGPSKKLAHMANKIAAFFSSYAEEQAVPAIAEHINQFWSKRMREDFVAAFTSNAADLAPLVRKALPYVISNRS